MTTMACGSASAVAGAQDRTTLDRTTEGRLDVSVAGILAALPGGWDREFVRPHAMKMVDAADRLGLTERSLISYPNAGAPLVLTMHGRDADGVRREYTMRIPAAREVAPAPRACDATAAIPGADAPGKGLAPAPRAAPACCVGCSRRYVPGEDNSGWKFDPNHGDFCEKCVVPGAMAAKERMNARIKAELGEVVDRLLGIVERMEEIPLSQRVSELGLTVLKLVREGTVAKADRTNGTNASDGKAKPRRAFCFDIHVEGDTLSNVLDSIDFIRNEIDIHGNYAGVSGCPSAGYSVTTNHSRGKSHEQYIVELEAYLTRCGRCGKPLGLHADGVACPSPAVERTSHIEHAEGDKL